MIVHNGFEPYPKADRKPSHERRRRSWRAARAADRSNPHTGCDRHSRHAIARGDEAGSCQTEVSVQYVDHNLLQIDNLNAEDHLFLESACRRYGIMVIRGGQRHQSRRSHGTLRAPRQIAAWVRQSHARRRSLGMLAIGAGRARCRSRDGRDPYSTTMPAVFGVELTGARRTGLAPRT